MARVTITSLVARLDAMQEEIEGLRASLASQVAPGTQIQFFRQPGEKWNTPEPISHPLDIQALAAGVTDSYSYYSEANDVYHVNDYL